MTVSIRSVSFTRSSAAPWTTLSPRAHRGGEREERQLVDEPRHLAAAVDLVAVSSAECTSRSPMGSPPTRAAVEDRDPRAHALEHVEEARPASG